MVRIVFTSQEIREYLLAPKHTLTYQIALIYKKQECITAKDWNHLGVKFERGGGDCAKDYANARFCYCAAILTSPDTWLFRKGNISFFNVVVLGVLTFGYSCNESDDNGHDEAVKFATANLAKLFRLGLGGQKDLVSARRYYLASLDINPSYYTAKKGLILTEGVERGFVTAVDWYGLGQDYYYQRNNKEKSYIKARACFEKAASMEGSHRESEYMLGWLYEFAQGVKKNIGEAKTWYVRASEKGHADSKKRLILIEGTEGKFGKPAQWHMLGESYYFGRNGKQTDLVKARFCYEKAGIFFSSYHRLGQIYHHGKGVARRDFVKARGFYEKSIWISRKDLRELIRDHATHLIDSGGSINFRYPSNDTLLHVAFKHNFYKQAARLLSLGIDRTIFDGRSRTAFSYCQDQIKFNKVNSIFTSSKSKLLDTIPNILCSRIFSSKGGIDYKQVKGAVGSIYGRYPDLLLPLFQLAKLAVLGRHRLSMASCVGDDYDSDDDDELAIPDISHFMIKIDESKDTVEDLELLERDGLGGQGAFGVYIGGENRISLGGVRGGSEFGNAFTRSTLVHELTHFVAYEVYSNSCNPYKEGSAQKTYFLSIVDALRQKITAAPQLFDPILRGAFSAGYTRNQHASELIVRVPQMLVAYAGSGIDVNGLVKLREQAPELLKYYENVFLNDVATHVRELSKKAHGGWSPSLFQAGPQQSSQPYQLEATASLANS